MHFNAICEHLAPYDTTFEIAAASELKDTKLSSACSLHAASCSTSSSTSSLRRRRLMEIAEEEEEEQRATKRQSVQDGDQAHARSPPDDAPTLGPVTLDAQLAASPEHAKFSAGSTSELPTFVGIDDRPTSPGKLSDAGSVRPELFNYSSYPYTKPRVKLGPRPSLETGGRPQTAGNFRPVSAIPAGFKLFGRGSKRNKGSKDNADATSPQDEAASINFPAPELPVPQESLRVHADAARPATSPGVSADLSSLAPPASKRPTISPEKARLMKAMKLREKKMNTQSRARDPSSNEASAGPASGPGGEIVEDQAHEDHDAHSPVDKDAGCHLPKADSGLALEPLSSSVHTDQTSDLTLSDSRPTSPVVASSEAEQSTKASSISESTHETVQAKGEEPPADEGSGSGPASKRHDGVDAARPGRGGDADIRAVSAEAPLAGVEAGGHAPPTPGQAVEPVEPSATGPVSEHTTSLPAGWSGHVPAKKEPSGQPAGPLMFKAPSNIPSPPMSPPQEAFLGDAHAEREGIPSPPRGTGKETATGSDAIAPPRPQSTASRAPTPSETGAAVEADAQPTAVSAVTQPELEKTAAAAAKEGEKSPTPDGSDTETIPGPTDRPRRRGLVEPIRTDLPRSSPGPSRTNLLDDEELMDELQSATVEEARPMLVAKTPVSATFPPSPVNGAATPGAFTVQAARATSNPVRGNLTVPTSLSQPVRSVSSGVAFLQSASQQHQPGGNLAKKSNIGSSISQRIKALEKLSAPTGDLVAPPVGRERPSSTFFAVKKREPSRSPSVADRANSLRAPAESPTPCLESSPEASKSIRRGRSGSVTSRLSIFESPPGASASSRSPGSAHGGRPESVSVTAKIVRDPSERMNFGLEPPKDPSEYNRLELKQSPLLVDHQKAVPSLAPVAAEHAPQDRLAAQEPGKGSKARQSSFSLVKDFIKERRRSVTSTSGDVLAAPASGSNPSSSPTRPPSTHQNSSFSPRLSISSRSSMSKDREGLASPTEENFVDDAKSSNGDKRLSRAGRFMRRLSNLSGARGKNNSPAPMSPTVAEEQISEPTTPRPATTGSPTVVSYMGDVNVQFPDSLLWKRRNMTLDSQGFLILSAVAAQSGRNAQGTKRYHLSEFRAPYMPDVEVQELPNSVVLDFEEGTSIQIACEDRAGQMHVLNSENPL